MTTTCGEPDLSIFAIFFAYSASILLTALVYLFCSKFCQQIWPDPSEDVTPKVTLVILISFNPPPSEPDCRKRCRSLSSRCNPTSRNIFDMSADIPIGCILKASITVVRRLYRFGPGSRTSFSATPVVVQAKSSNSTRSCVVVLESFTTPCARR